MIRILCTSTKGGVGKSTIAQQVATTYLLDREGTGTLIELDDQNVDSRWMKSSKIESRQIVVDGDAGFAVLDLFEEFAGKSFVLDIGNQTAEAALAAMGRNGLLGRFDLILVPVKDVGQDVENAKRTINKIREDEPAAKIALVLNGLSRKTQDPNDRRIRALYGDVFDLGEDLNVPVLIMPGVEGYGLSRNFGKTLLEIAAGADALIAQLREQSLILDRDGKGKDARRCMVLVEVVAIAKEASTWIKQLHGKFDELRGADQEAA